jgi:hypothetical protein
MRNINSIAPLDNLSNKTAPKRMLWGFCNINCHTSSRVNIFQGGPDMKNAFILACIALRNMLGQCNSVRDIQFEVELSNRLLKAS